LSYDDAPVMWRDLKNLPVMSHGLNTYWMSVICRCTLRKYLHDNNVYILLPR